MVDIFDDEERTERLVKFWKEWGIAIVVAILIALAGFIGWRLYQAHQENILLEAADLFYRYELAVEAEDQDRADEITAEYLQKYPRTGYSVYLLLIRAQESAESEDYETTLEHLNSALARTGDKTLTELIQIRIARVYVQLDRQEEALDILPTTNSGYAAIVQEIRGDIHRNREEFELAQQYYEDAREKTYTSSHRERIDLKIALMPKGATTESTDSEPSS